MRVFILVFALSAVGVAATFARYGSLHPCDWLRQDMTAASILPESLVRGQIRLRSFLEGTIEPDALDCLEWWWSFRSKEIEEIEAAE